MHSAQENLGCGQLFVRSGLHPDRRFHWGQRQTVSQRAHHFHILSSKLQTAISLAASLGGGAIDKGPNFGQRLFRPHHECLVAGHGCAEEWARHISLRHLL